MSSFAELKQRRAGATTNDTPREPTAGASSSNAREKSSESAMEGITSSSAAGPSSDWTPKLPSALEIRVTAERGRGVFAKEPFKPGRVILSTRPLVSVLDNNHIAQYCSTCFVSRTSCETQPRCDDSLSRCTSCRAIMYCSRACQLADWPIHRFECKAFKVFAAMAKLHKAVTNNAVPDTAIRVLGRLLWMHNSEGKDVWRQYVSLRSHRMEASPMQKEEAYKLSVALASYVGPETLRAACSSAAEAMDMCSRLTGNTFGLTSPDHGNIGVSISPPAALFNHSCAPNAVVNFPRYADPAEPTHLRVVVIKPIKPEEEVLTSYLDLAPPRRLRRAELLDIYKFHCDCPECERPSQPVDPREALRCAKASCSGLTPMPNLDGEAHDVTVMQRCDTCSASRAINVAALAKCIKQAEKELEHARSLPNSELLEGRNILRSIVAACCALGLADSAHPLLSTRQELVGVELALDDWDSAVNTLSTMKPGLDRVFDRGHPNRAVANAMAAKLQIWSHGDEVEDLLRNGGRTEIFEKLLAGCKDAMEELKIGSGDEEPFGVLIEELQTMTNEMEIGREMLEMQRGMDEAEAARFRAQRWPRSTTG